MDQTREQISLIILGLNAGDEVTVVWLRDNHKSVESGIVWNPSDSVYWGLGANLLDPTDPELFSVTVNRRTLVLPPEPPVGSVAVWSLDGGKVVQSAKRAKKGWQVVGSSLYINWSWLTGGATIAGPFPLTTGNQWGAPVAVYQPGQAPAAPTLESVTGGPGSLEIDATLGSDNGSPILEVQYKLNFTSGTTGWRPSGQTTGSFTVTGLAPDVSYDVTVRAVNSRGASTASNAISGTPTWAN